MSRRLLDLLLEPGALRPRFEPIVNLSTKGLGTSYLEGLVSGPRGTSLERAEALFSYVRRTGETARIDRLCVAAILRAAQSVDPGVAVGINVDASTLSGDRIFPRFLVGAAEGAGIDPSRLVVEIVEHSLPRSFPTFRHALEVLRGAGVRVALDDVGGAHSNYRMMLETRPDFFKVDRYFVAGAAADPFRQKVLSSIARLAESFGARVVAEGVESDEDLAAVCEAGIDLAQGYLFARLTEPGIFEGKESFKC